MNISNTQELLEEYVRHHSEHAFEELVRRYINLVYTAALRRAGGETLLAEDVTQLVFTDLARKAATLGKEVQLGGWLHRHTGFIASSIMRGEQRRRAREKQAVEMNALNRSSERDWKEVAPILDEAIDQLDTTDRDAIVLRYFERCDLRSVGAALGATEDAAQKRVSRAVEKLRDFLVKRGAALSVGALAVVLGECSVEATPSWLSASVSRAALSAAGGGAGVAGMAALSKLLASVWAKVALGATALLIVATVLVTTGHSQRTAAAKSSLSSQNVNPAPISQKQELAQMPAVSGAPAEAITPADSNALHLVIVAADSGKPVPNVQIDYRGWEEEKFTGKTLAANRFGVCDVSIPRSTTTRLELTTRCDGFADTRLHWEKGVIQAAHTLRLVRPTPIGGYVVDPDGQPLPSAKVGFNHADDPATVKSPEDHHFGWIQVSTDTNGHWSIERIAPEMLRTIYGSSSHPDFVQAPMMFPSQDKQAEEALRAGKYTFHLGRPVTVHGFVTGPTGLPVAGAKILVGRRGVSDSRKGETLADGSFVVAGCRPGKSPVSAEAEGFAAATMETELSTNSEPIQLTLQPGKILILRLVNGTGGAVTKAHVWLDTMRQVPNNDPDYGKLPVQAQFNGTPDAQGYVTWSNAPDTELAFDIGATGFMRLNGLKVRPDGQEHTITLPSALVVLGTVRDAETGRPVPRFKIITGWPGTNFVIRPPAAQAGTGTNTQGGLNSFLEPSLVPRWSSFARDHLEFTDGKFKHVFETPLIFGMPNPGYMLKVEAAGYASFISRPIRPDEGEVQLDIALRAAKETSVTVLLPDGRPAAQADVGLLTPGAMLELVPGGFSHQALSGTELLMTDTAGNFILPSEDTISRVIIAHPAGFAEVTPPSLSANPVVQLQAWGRLEGTFLAAGQPAANRELIFAYGGSDGMSVRASFESYRVKTDQAGRFVFEQVPPGKHKINKLVPADELGSSSKGTLAHVPVADVEIRPGETTTTTIGTGYSIKATLRWPDGVKPEANGRVFAHIQTAYPAELGEAMKAAFNDPAAVATLRQSPAAQEYARNARHYRAETTDSQNVSADGIPAGNYILVVGLGHQMGPGERPSSWIGSETTFTVPAEPANGTLDLGEIVLAERKIATGQ